MASSNPFRRRSAAINTSIATASLAEDRFPSLNALDSSSTSAAAPPRSSFYDGRLPEPPVDEQTSKPVKHVRLLSPPPLSPDSPEWAFSPPPPALSNSQLNDADADPFDAVSSDESDREMVSASPKPQPQSNSRVPPNPFNKTLRDLEGPNAQQDLEDRRRQEGAALKAGNTARRSMDVNTFKRLLMTGNSASVSSPSPPRTQPFKLGHQRSATESFSPSQRPGLSDSKEARTPPRGGHETSLISEDPVSESPEEELDDESISDSSISVQLSRWKKPPPPPSSRHGKSIKLELKDDRPGLELPQRRSSDMNKPLPPAPVRASFEDDAESPFDRESVGKVPELDVTPAPLSRSISTGGKKAVPAPPPRRGHARAESKANALSSQNILQQMVRNHEDEPPFRTSLESTRSRSEQRRHDTHALAPLPPPRRSFVGSRQSTILSPGGTILGAAYDHFSSSSSSSMALPEAERSTISLPSMYTTPLEPAAIRDPHTGGIKLSAPPPPPARNPSVRRPASVRSIDSTSRRISSENKAHNGIAPPPPPRRQRGNSRSSIEGGQQQQQQQPGRTSADYGRSTPRLSTEGTSPEPVAVLAPTCTSTSASASTPVPIVTQDGVSAPQSATATATATGMGRGKGVDILADLTALQREVDALRGKLR